MSLTLMLHLPVSTIEASDTILGHVIYYVMRATSLPGSGA